MEEEVDDIFDGRRKKVTEKFSPSRTGPESGGYGIKAVLLSDKR